LNVLLLRRLEKEAGNRPTAGAIAQSLQEMERSEATATEDNRRQEFSLQAGGSISEATLKHELLTPVATTDLKAEASASKRRNSLRRAIWRSYRRFIRNDKPSHCGRLPRDL
jgi:hypothetical protein